MKPVIWSHCLHHLNLVCMRFYPTMENHLHNLMGNLQFPAHGMSCTEKPHEPSHVGQCYWRLACGKVHILYCTTIVWWTVFHIPYNNAFAHELLTFLPVPQHTQHFLLQWHHFPFCSCVHSALTVCCRIKFHENFLVLSSIESCVSVSLVLCVLGICNIMKAIWRVLFCVI